MTSRALTALIVDDEPLGRELVRHMLAAHAGIQVVGECGDGEKALAAIRRHSPQVVFLDIRMPRLDGMELLQKLPAENRPLIVFLTAHDTYALRAFEGHAFDYLLKPFDQDRFDQTVERVRSHLEQVEAAKLGQSVRRLLQTGSESPKRAAIGSAATSFADRLVVRDRGRIFFVATTDIVWLEASGNYVALHVTSGKTHLVHETMHAIETKLDPRQFVRIHRSTIVNVGAIKELQPHFNGEFVVVLKNEARLKLSRSYVGKARVALGLD